MTTTHLFDENYYWWSPLNVAFKFEVCWYSRMNFKNLWRALLISTTQFIECTFILQYLINLTIYFIHFSLCHHHLQFHNHILIHSTTALPLNSIQYKIHAFIFGLRNFTSRWASPIFCTNRIFKWINFCNGMFIIKIESNNSFRWTKRASLIFGLVERHSKPIAILYSVIGWHHWNRCHAIMLPSSICIHGRGFGQIENGRVVIYIQWLVLPVHTVPVWCVYLISPWLVITLRQDGLPFSETILNSIYVHPILILCSISAISCVEWYNNRGCCRSMIIDIKLQFWF